MKWITFLCFLWGSVVLFSGCKKREQEREATSYPIQFGVAAALTADATTRAIITGGILPQGDSVGVFAYSYETDGSWPVSIDLYDNAKALIGAFSNSVSGLSVASPKYYVPGKKHAFYAYYPYRSGSGKILSGDILTDKDASGQQIDWLCADPKTDVTPSSTPVQLNFGHTMSMVRVRVLKSTAITSPLTLQQLSFTTTTSQKFTLDITNGVPASVANGSLYYACQTNYPIPAVGSTDVATNVLFLPTSLVSTIGLTINGEHFSTPADWTGLTTSVSGQYKTVNFTIYMNEILVTFGEKYWENGEETDLRNQDIPTNIIIGDKGWTYDPNAIDLRPLTIPFSFAVGGQEWTGGGSIDLRKPAP